MIDSSCLLVFVARIVICFPIQVKLNFNIWEENIKFVIDDEEQRKSLLNGSNRSFVILIIDWLEYKNFNSLNAWRKLFIVMPQKLTLLQLRLFFFNVLVFVFPLVFSLAFVFFERFKKVFHKSVQKFYYIKSCYRHILPVFFNIHQSSTQ